MFEKEAIRHAFEDTIGVKCLLKPVEDFTYEELSDEQQEKAYDFQKGAEFGYNKANEWHYVKDGDLPKDNEYIIIYSKLADNIAVGKRRCAGKVRRRCVYEWYFATYEGTYCLRDKDIIAWKEIVLPMEIKEND